ncbi:MAG: hypothetical protein NZM36_06595 [Aquificaceae bacterium]|nr:hypothetical protein [Aquificaceae bacterium]
MERSYKQINDVDILNALAILQAKEAGLITEDLANEQIGVYGAYESQLAEILERAEEGEITEEEAKQQVQSAAKRVLVVEELVSKGYDALSKKAIEFVSKRIPVLTTVAKEIAKALRKPTINAVSDYVIEIVKKVNALDVISAISIFTAKEAGLIKEDLTNKQVGVYGGYKSDIVQIVEELVSNAISDQEAKEQVLRATKKVSVVDTIVSRGYDSFIEKVARAVSKISPIAEAVVRTVARVIKEPVVRVVSETIKTAASAIKSRLKSVFSKS